MQCYGPPRPGLAGPRFDAALGVLSAVLREHGHETGLLRLESFEPSTVGERITRFRPDVLYADIAPTCPDLARRVLGHTGRKHALHTIAGGVFVTVEPEAALSFPGVDAIVVGEPEQAFPAYLAAHLTGEPGDPIPGLWCRDEQGMVRSAVHPLTADLDSLPFADRTLFDNGELAEDVPCQTVSVGRGCPLRCAYCPNERIADLYSGHGPHVRRRSPDNICDEIDQICVGYPHTARIRFDDHLFALDEPWLAGFAKVYARRCGVPFECHLRAPSVSERVADLLVTAGCVAADIEVVSASDFVRNEILAMDLSDEQLTAAFDRLRSRGIATRAISLVGTPYCTEMSAAALVKLDRRLKPDRHEVRVFYPLPGTRALDICREAGWLSNRGEENYTLQRSILDMPNMPAATIERIARRLGRKLGASGRPGFWAKLGRIPVICGRRLSKAFAALRGRNMPRSRNGDGNSARQSSRRDRLRCCPDTFRRL